MKAAIYNAIKDVSVEEVPIPQIGENDVLVKNLRAGICGSDTGGYIHGGEHYGIFPGKQFGHEMVSKVVEKGANVGDDIAIGDIVWVNPTTCKKEGIFVADMAGAFSEYVNVDNAKLGYNLYKLPADIDLDAAVLIEPLAVGTNGAIKQGAKADDKVVVLGAGTIGLSAAAGLIARGLKNIIVVDVNDWRLEKAAELGAKTIKNQDVDLFEEIAKIFGGEKNYYGQTIPDVDLYVDAAGFGPLLADCFAHARQDTKYTIVAVYSQPVPLSMLQFIMSEPTITGSRGYTDETIAEVLDHIINKRSNIKTILTSKFKKEDFVQAMETAVKADHNIKVVIDYEME
ncbi:MAG: zinc-binding dehydrogenase [Erysipelotrichaceae bacterium]|jgi:2-desacetyl-2-hydroxyethyl bacteriochlorophyllide A dehydrogenase|nr:zinc-binding dehydrogenase [Erysipelotrichaceae bacterium]